MGLAAELTEDSKIFALKAPQEDDWKEKLVSSLNEGIGRFGWSYMWDDSGNRLPDADLLRLKEIKWNDLTLEEQKRNQTFLLSLNPGDWVVYINLPEWGKCTLAKVAGSYFWRTPEDDDFNHCFPVQTNTIRVIDRNDARIPEALATRLRLMRRYWTINAPIEFRFLLEQLDAGQPQGPRTAKTNADYLTRQLEPALVEVTRLVQRHNPNTALEYFLELVFKEMPGVKRVKLQGGAGDKGADLIVEFESGIPFPGFQRQTKCVVQVKSYVNTHWDMGAIDDIRRAFRAYPDADMGVIFSTADSATKEFEDALQALGNEFPEKKVELIIGADVARFVLQFGSNVLRPLRIQP